MVKYVGPLIVYKIIDPENYLLMTLDGKTFCMVYLNTKGLNQLSLGQVKAIFLILHT